MIALTNAIHAVNVISHKGHNELYIFVVKCIYTFSMLLMIPCQLKAEENRVDSILWKIQQESLMLCDVTDDQGLTIPCPVNLKIINSSIYDASARNGEIYITRRLLDVSNDNELAFVIAHEMAHIVIGHTGSSINSELEADYWAARFMKRSGFDANAARSVLNRLQTRRVLGFPFSLFSHPANSRRLAVIRGALEDERESVLVSTPIQPQPSIGLLVLP